MAYDDCLRLYNEVQAVELDLRNLLIDAFEPQYLQALRDKHTDMINESFDTYGKVTDAEMLYREQNLSSMVYNTTQPVHIIFNAIDEFSTFLTLKKCQLLTGLKYKLHMSLFSVPKPF